MGIKPHTLAKDVLSNVWEYISFPWWQDGKEYVNVRVPGDPSTVQTIQTFEVSSEGMGCSCEAAKEVGYATGEFYFRDPRPEARAQIVRLWRA